MQKNTFKRLSTAGILAGILFCAAPAAVSAADSTVLTGKVMTPVERFPASHFNGIIDEILVSPGDHVKEGQPLMRYTLQPEARRNLQREVDNGDGTEGWRAQIIDMERELARVQAERNKARSLAASGLGSNQASSRLEKDVSLVQGRIDILRSQLNRNEANFRDRLKELSGYFDQPIREKQQLPEYLYLKSPVDGYVLTRDSKSKGSTFNAGFAPVRIGQMDPLYIAVPVYESEIADVKVGDKAKVEIPSLHNKQFEATVTQIAWFSNDMNVSSPSYYNVEMSIPNPNLDLKPGFKAVVRFGK